MLHPYRGMAPRPWSVAFFGLTNVSDRLRSSSVAISVRARQSYEHFCFINRTST